MMLFSLDGELSRIWPKRQVERPWGFPALSPDKAAGVGQDGRSSWLAGKAGVLQKGEEPVRGVRGQDHLCPRLSWGAGCRLQVFSVWPS